ncbi:hypothetical protein P4E94_01845 [Pontiellaceae bacterium B12219]|nr:hypothetical protein [Pontiellaceae bacterium B12219]
MAITGDDYRIFGSYLLAFGWGCLFISTLSGNREKRAALNIYGIMFAVYASFTVIAHFIYVDDPEVDYFFHNDQLVFYKVAVDVGSSDWLELISSAFISLYSEFPGAALLFGFLAKIGMLLGVSDLLFFLKLHVVMLVASVPAMIWLMLYELGYRKSVKCDIIFFSVISYIFVYSGILTRDPHILFVYTLMGYIVVKQKLAFRYLILFSLVLLAGLLRLENGLFALAFVFVRAVIDRHKLKKLDRVVLITSMIIAGVLVFGAIFSVMQQTAVTYHERFDAISSEGALSARIRNLPFPVNIIAVAVYTQLLPFPVWGMLSVPYGGNLIVVSILTPFYWMYVWTVSIYPYFLRRRPLKPEGLLLLLAGVLVMITSYIAPTSRRLMVVYPLVFVAYVAQRDMFSHKQRSIIGGVVCVFICAIHLIYFVIK